MKDDKERIVITGVGLTSPNGNTLGEFRANLLNGVSGIVPYNIRYFGDTFAGGAAAAWGSPYEESPLWKWHYDLDLIRNLRDVVHDMGLEDFNDTGTYRD